MPLVKYFVKNIKLLHQIKFEKFIGAPSHCFYTISNPKRIGANNSTFQALIGTTKSWSFPFPVSGNGGLHQQGMAISANQPISGKLPKWHFLTHAWNSNIFWPKLLLLKCFESAIKWLYPKSVSGSVQVLKQWIKVDKLNFFKNAS